MEQRHDKVKEKKINEARSRLKASIMFNNSAYPEIKQDCADNWLARAQNAKEALPEMKEPEVSQTPTFKQMENAARQFAQMIGPAEAKRKLRSLENMVLAAATSEEQRYAIARLYPRMEKTLQAATKKMVAEYWGRWPASAFAQLIHLTRIFFEAKSEGFKLGG